MQKDNLKLKSKVMHFSLKAVEARKDPPSGDFNKWNPDADLMQNEDNGTWTIAKNLSPGNLEYK